MEATEKNVLEGMRNIMNAWATVPDQVLIEDTCTREIMIKIEEIHLGYQSYFDDAKAGCTAGRIRQLDT